MVVESLADVLGRTGVDVHDIDHCLIPEGNVGWMLDALEEAGLETKEWMALDGKIFDNLAMTGAVGCAAVPLFLDDAWRTGLVKQGDKVLVIGVEATAYIYAGVIIDWTAPDMVQAEQAA
jgi:3-oxoacyl-[acyl-carrier-protein] synthase-3